MYSVTNAAAMREHAANQNAAAKRPEGDAFGLMLDTLRKGGAPEGDALLETLGRRFPGMNFSLASAPAGATGAESVAGNGEGDYVAIDPAAAESFAGNGMLRDMLEKALAAFAESAGQVRAGEGAYAQRAVMVTTVSIRFTVSRYSGETGDLLSAAEMKSAFTEKLEEMIRAFFGRDVAAGENGAAAGGEDATDADAAAGAEDASGAGANGSFAWSAGVSFSLYFSAALISRLGSGDGGAINASQLSGAFQFSARGGFQNFVDNFFPYAIFNGAQGSGFGSGPFTSMLNGALGQMGLATESLWRQDGGYLFNLGASGGFLAELMSLYGASSAASSPSGEAVGAAATAGSAAPAVGETVAV